MSTDNSPLEDSPDKGGRPTKYEQRFNKQAQKLCLLGYTHAELAGFFEVNEDTIYEWIKKYKRFSEAIKKGKELADIKVADSLYKRANGYSHPDTDIKVIDGKVVQTRMTKHYPPDTAAAIFWLKNRQKKKWREKVETGITDNDGNDVTTSITLNLGK